MRFTLLLVLISKSTCSILDPPSQAGEHYGDVLLAQAGLHGYGASPLLGQSDVNVREHVNLRIYQRKVPVNFLARYTYGNKQNLKGIKNFHLDIRSLANKISEVKNIVKEHQPHILSISECELKKVADKIDESKWKVPGYDLLFPKSWTTQGLARVVTYVKKTLEYEQVHDLQNNEVQSIWLRAGFKNCKKLFICHAYREHLSTVGGSLRYQRIILEKLLGQWGDALTIDNNNEENEVHISGDMNLDALDNRWLDPTYPLVSLANLVQSTCNSFNFSQLVSRPTRSQYNSVNKTTAISCIDHEYTNRKYRCSKVTVYPFGGSDHDIIGYTRYTTKVPPAPSRAIRKRSYKKFIKKEFLQELGEVDWTEVYTCQDVDSAAETFTRKFVDVLNRHAPWIVYQERKNYKPWVTEETKIMIKARNELKKEAINLASSGDSEGAATAWTKFKKVRNKVSNRVRYEENNYKSEIFTKNLDSPSNIWRLAKSFMDWRQAGGPPHQLVINSKLITKASIIATEMNTYFVKKVQMIREGISFLGNQFTMCKEIMVSKKCKLNIRYVSV